MEKEFTSENYKHQLDVWLRTYGISREKLNLFHDFLISLYDLIDSTYMGAEYMYNETDQRAHFNWCWDKQVEQLSKERIFFKSRGDCYDYFWIFFLDTYYINQIKNKAINISQYFNRLFDLTIFKTRSELDLINHVYFILDQNLKK